MAVTGLWSAIKRENLSFHHRDTGKHKVEQMFPPGGFLDELCQSNLFAGSTALRLPKLFLLENFSHLR